MNQEIKIRRARATKGRKVIGVLVASDRGCRCLKRRHDESIELLHARAFSSNRSVIAIREVLTDA